MRSSLGETRVTEGLRKKFLYFAWRKYGLTAERAEDIVQTSFATFLEVRDRYPEEQEHPAILAGIFRNKCREYFSAEARQQRNVEKLGQALRDASSGSPTRASPHPSPLDEMIRRENCRLILETLADLKPEARELFRMVLEEGSSRKDLIRRLGLNKNTLDSRLHAYRRQLARMLRGRGLSL